MTTKFKRVSATSKYKKRARKNWGKEIKEGIPTLRYYIIAGKERLVWVWKENGKYKIRVNESYARPISSRTAWLRQRNEAFKNHKVPMERKKLPKNIRNALAKLSEDDIEWGGGIDFEKGFSIPERFIIKSGGDSYIDISELEDFELTFHTHPIDSDIGYLPSPKDIALVQFGKPHIIVWTNEKTGKKKFTLIESTKNDDEVPYKERLEEIRKIRKNLIDTFGGNTSKEYYKQFIEDLKKKGYNASPIDPVRTKIQMNSDRNPEDPKTNVVIVRPTRDFTKKHVQEIINETPSFSESNIKEALMKIQIEADNSDNELSTKVNTIIGNDHTEEPRKKLSQIKTLVEMKKVTQLRKDVKKANMPYVNNLEINHENYDRIKKDLARWKKTDNYKKIKREAQKRRMKKMSTPESQRIKSGRKGTGKPMNVGLQQHVISTHVTAMTKEDPTLKGAGMDIEDLQAFIDPELTLEENISEIDSMMRYGAFEAEKKVTKAQAQRELKDMMELMKKGRKNLTTEETERLNRYTHSALKSIGEEKYIPEESLPKSKKKPKQYRLEAPKKVTKPKPQKQVIEIDPKIEDSIKVKGNEWEIDRISMAKSNNSIQIGLKAKTGKSQQKRLGKPLSQEDKKNVKRMLGWKRIKDDKKLKATLEATLE